MWQASEGEGKGKHERVKRETIGRGRIVVGDASLSRAHFDFPPFLRPATHAIGSTNMCLKYYRSIYRHALASCLYFFTVRTIFYKVTRFSKSGQLFQTHLTQCNPFFSVTHIILCDQFLQWDPFFFLNMTHFSQCNPFFSVTHIIL